MPWITGGLSLLGGLLGGNSAQNSARQQAAAQQEAARLAAEEARFRPVGVTTRFGTSQFTTGPDGRVSGAGYTLSPEMQAMQDRFLGLAGQGLSQAEGAQQQFAPLQEAGQGLFGLGQQYLAQSPQQAAQQYMASQQELLAPSRERQMSQLQNTLFQQGRGGLSVGATGARPSGAAGLGATTPEMEAYYNAMAQQDAALAAQADQAGQQRALFGAGLLGTGGNLITQGYQGQVGALSPYQAYLQGATGLETLGQQPLDIGINIGAKGMSPSAANAIYGGGMGAAGTNAAANAYNPFATALVQGSQNPQLVNSIQNLFGGGRSPGFVDYVNTGNTANLSPYYQNRLFGT
ncbi:hypothetical protein UFOVP376_38 [uncultured Caudovirales phage]|uniref:Uncharacterized protein n=1 Tax=uncultured Caudovirales phage TaxID=2100421 RepID=A0A6J7WY51_9CAUD|nr:hypothetical protein UFOVP376_38 [uncultured Caudovirales phage]